MQSGLLWASALALASLFTPMQLAAQQPPRTVAFTFDDLPAHGPLAPGQQRRDVVTSILATLQREKMPPSYGFINGFRLLRFPYQVEILQAWHNAGQPLGNHTFSHPELDKITVEAFGKQVERNEPILQKVDPNGDWHWFRYPFMEEGDTLAKREGALDYLHRHGYRVAEISMNFQDYKWNDAYGACLAKHDTAAMGFLHDSYLAAADHYITIYSGLSHQLFGRDIAYVLLLHVGSFDAKMLPELIALYRKRGFQFVTLQQAESDPAYAIDPKVGVKGGGSFLELLANSRKVELTPDMPLLDKVDAICR